MQKLAKSYKAWVVAVPLVFAGWFGFLTLRKHLAQQGAENAVQETIRAVLKGDYATMERYQFGDELSRMGVTRQQLEAFRKSLLDGYLSPDARIAAVREPVVLPNARNDYERNMQNRIRERSETSPEFRITIERADGKGEISFVTYAVRNTDGWVVSPAATLAWLQGCYSKDKRERYARVAEALRRAGISKLSTPSGSWMELSRLNAFLRNEISEAQIFR